MQRNAEKIERKRNSSQLCRPSASLCVAASLRQPYPFTNSFSDSECNRPACQSPRLGRGSGSLGGLDYAMNMVYSVLCLLSLGSIES